MLHFVGGYYASIPELQHTGSHMDAVPTFRSLAGTHHTSIEPLASVPLTKHVSPPLTKIKASLLL